MPFDAGDYVPVSDRATANAAYVRSAHEHVPVSDRATVNAGYGRTAHEDVPISDTASVGVLVAVPGARVIAAASGPTVTITRRSDVSAPGLEVGLEKNQWDLTTIGAGVTVGFAVAHLPGAIIGGGVCWAWGQWRWRQTHP